MLIHLVFSIVSQQRLVLDHAWQFSPNATGHRHRDDRAVRPRRADVERAGRDLDDRRAELGVLHADAGGRGDRRRAGPSAGEVSYYFGRDSDGAWTEGAPWDRAWLPSVPPGRYVLIVEPEGPQPFNYRVRLTRDVPRPLFVWLAIGALCLPPIVFWWRKSRFELRRWVESDHPMSGQSSSSDDDE